MARRKQPIIPDALLDQLLAGADAKTAFEKDGLLGQQCVLLSVAQAVSERRGHPYLDSHPARPRNRKMPTP